MQLQDFLTQIVGEDEITFKILKNGQAVILTATPEDNEEVARRLNWYGKVLAEEFTTKGESGHRGSYHFKILIDGTTHEISVLTQTMLDSVFAFSKFLYR